MKLPEPDGQLSSYHSFTALKALPTGRHDLYTKATLKQAVKDALEAAAKVSETAANRLGGHQFAAKAIRNMAKEIV